MRISASSRTQPNHEMRPEMDAETALLDAEYLADLLERNSKQSTRVFAHTLADLAKDLRLAIIAEANHEELLRLHLRLETTMRMAYSEVLSPEASEPEPASQRPTLPYPMDFPAMTTDEPENDTDREAVTVRHPRPISEVRRRVSLPSPPIAQRKPIGWARAFRR